MSALGLVAYASSDESDADDLEAEEPRGHAAEKVISDAAEDKISDDEDDHRRFNGPHLIDDEAEDIIGVSTAKEYAWLPRLTSEVTTAEKGGGFIDEHEDLSSIPTANEAELKSRENTLNINKNANKKNKKKGGKVQIVLRGLNEFDDEDSDDGERNRPRVRVQQQNKSSTLLSMLPKPKGGGASLGASAKLPGPTPLKPNMLIPDSVSRKRPNISTEDGAVKVTSKKKAKPAKVKESDDEEEEDGGQISFFNLDSEVNEQGDISGVSAAIQVKPTPKAVPSSDRPLSFKGREHEVDLPDYKAVVGPALPSTSKAHYSYPEASDLMANSEALERLAGKHAVRRNKMNNEEQQIIDVRADNLTGDPREWLVKAMTEDDPNKPGPKNNVKGVERSRHQITYLAAYAKENESKFKAQWATSAANKRAAGAKYGFF